LIGYKISHSLQQIITYDCADLQEVAQVCQWSIVICQ